MDEGPRDIPLRQFGKYSVTAIAGAGGMGVVYEATDTVLGRTVALKFLPPAFEDAEGGRERFLREAVTASSLDHPNIGTVFGIEEIDGRRAIVLAYYAGGSLRDRLKSGPLPGVQAVAIAAEMAAGLAAAHARGIVHRDIKPSNILFGLGSIVKIVDFGLAKAQHDSDITATGSTVGTAGYMPPEQTTGAPVGPPGDVWALGVVLYEMLTGRRPFEGDSYAAVAHAVLHNDPDLTAIPAPIAKVLRRALAKKPAGRYPTAREMLADLESLRAVGVLSSEAVTRTLIAPFPKRRLTLRWAAVIAALAAGVAAVAVLTLWKPRVRQVVVLPAKPDPLAGGLAALLIDDLRAAAKNYRGLRVAGASEIERADVSTVAAARQKLGADLVFTVDVLREGGNLRAVLTLIDAKQEKIDATRDAVGQAAGLAAVEAAVATHAAGLLGVTLSPRAGALAALQSSAGFDPYVRATGLLRAWKDQQNPNAAIALLEDAQRNVPRNAAVQAALCNAYRLEFNRTSDPKWLETAAAPCQDAPDGDPRFVPGFVQRGSFRLQRGDVQGGIRDLEQALALDAESDNAARFLAEAYDRAGLHDKAEATIRKAVDQNPNSPLAYYELGEILRRSSRFLDAAAAYRRVTELAPEYGSAWTRLGSSLSEGERLPQAEQAFLHSLQLAPTFAAYANLGNLYLRQERFGEAGVAYQKALEKNPRDHRVWSNLAVAYSRTPGKQGQSKDAYLRAAELCRETVKVTPDDAVTLSDLASYEAFTGKRAEPLELIQRALALAPKDPEVLYNGVEVYEFLGFREQALLWIERLLAQGYPPKDLARSVVLVELRKDKRYQQVLAR